MTPLFANGPEPQTRIIIAILLSFVLMFVDHRMQGFDSIRVYLNSMVSPIMYAANLPQRLLDWSAESLSSRSDLLDENARLRESHLLLSERLQRMRFLERENDRLRALLGSPLRQDIRKMVTEVMSVESNPNSHQLVLNRGSLNGVYEGQAVLDENGIVGQVVSVGTTTSRVLLISDHTHAIPVRVERNAVRSIAIGTGSWSRIELSFVPHSTDIKVGDRLISSGLGQRFPEGYPVAEVSSVVSNESLPFAQIQARPIAALDRVRYLLLLWPPDAEKQPQKGALKNLAEEAEALIP
ncbi:rod shape-determining protein MreC [Catenovulum sediminis]|uniref:Cell shape-determining protein MreC n=1 Tax=Catenovulum sediminis TaxID=1740262 RepID=A0ABV1RD59_9ALTE